MHVSDQVIQVGAARFAFDTAALARLGGGGAPDGFVFANERDPFVLKIMPLRAEEQLPVMHAKLDFVNYLRAGGVNTPGCVPSEAGNLIEVVSDDAAQYAVFKLDKAPGHPVNFDDPREWNADFFHKWGYLVGQVHALSRDYAAPSRDTIPDWEAEHAGFAALCADEPEVHEQWLAIGEQCRALPITPDAFGPMHNDPHSWNFLIEGDTLTMLDFDVCVRSWFALDVAIALFHPLFESRRHPPEAAATFVRSVTDHFLAGYEQAYALDPLWLEHIALFMKYRRTLFYIVLPKNASDHWTSTTVRDLRLAVVNDHPLVTGLD